MSNNQLFAATKKYVTAERISLLLASKKKNQKEAVKQEFTKKEKEYSANPFIIDKKKALSIQKKSFTKKDFLENFIFSASSFDNYLNKNFPGNDAFQNIKKVLDKEDNIELIFGSTDNETTTDEEIVNNITQYEHELFFDILDDAKDNLKKEISNYNGMNPLIDTVLAKYKGSMHSKRVVSLVKTVWEEFRFQIPREMYLEGYTPQTSIELANIDDYIQDVENNISLYKNDYHKLAIYLKKFDYIKSFYRRLFTYDNSKNFSISSERFQHFNRLDKITRNTIQKEAIEDLVNIVYIVHIVNNEFNSLANHGAPLRLTTKTYDMGLLKCIQNSYIL